jgi:polyhydroxyalkanoate synthesis repressor PhaR
MSASAEPVEIRRYPNRRLYDRSRRRYVTLQEIEELVREGRTVLVRDSRTGEDLTRSILTQILLERHPEKMEMFPVAMLHAILRANDLALEFLRGYLRQSLAALEAVQKAAPAPLAAPGPLPFASPIDWMSAFLPGWAGAVPHAAAPPADALARRVHELEGRLARLETGAGGAEDEDEPPPEAADAGETPPARPRRRGRPVKKTPG